MSESSVNLVSESKKASRSNEKLSVNEVMNEYYKLKAKYETDYHEKYIKPILKAVDKSKREKRLEYQKLPKAECINCKRNVGSIFTTKQDTEEYGRTFIAKCGDLSDPCPLDIKFNYTGRDELSKESLTTDKDINEIKNKIIIDKNNMMFGYVAQAEAIANFNADTSELKTITEGAGFIMEINIQLNDNPVKNNLIKQNEDKLGMEFLLPFKDMIKTFDQTGNVEVINKAMKFYIEEMVPLIATIRNLKYEVCYVDFLEKKDNDDPDEKGDLYILMQRKNSLQNLEYTLYGSDELKSFTKGVNGFNAKSSANKTMKNLEQVHNKTRKLKPSNIEFDIDDEDEDEEEGNKGDEENKGDEGNKGPINLRKKLVLQNATEALNQKLTVDELNPEYEGIKGDIMPHKGPGGSITWKDSNDTANNEYQQVWFYLKPEYKAALSEDEAWMKKTMDHFVEFARLKRAKKVPYMASREFVHPDGLLVPPKKISETEYDFGNALYNKILNNENKQRTILILLSFLPKPGPKSAFPDADDNIYKQYMTALASIVGGDVKFTTF